MNFFSRMVNSWSLAWEVLNGTMDETYPIREDVPDNLWGKKIPDYDYDFDDLDHETDYYRTADIDDMYMHHFTNANSPYNDGWTQEYHREQLEKFKEPMAHYFKYHEEEILKDIQEYVSGTYQAVSYTHLTLPTTRLV